MCFLSRALPLPPSREQRAIASKLPSFNQPRRSSIFGHHCSILSHRSCANPIHSSHSRGCTPVQLSPFIQSCLCAGPTPRHLGALLHLMQPLPKHTAPKRCSAPDGSISYLPLAQFRLHSQGRCVKASWVLRSSMLIVQASAMVHSRKKFTGGGRFARQYRGSTYLETPHSEVSRLHQPNPRCNHC